MLNDISQMAGICLRPEARVKNEGIGLMCIKYEDGGPLHFVMAPISLSSFYFIPHLIVSY